MTESQIRHMVDRFLGWRLPENFSPDCGIQFDADAAKKLDPRNHRYEPVGANLFDAEQAAAMVKYMFEGLPTERDGSGLSDEEHEFIRKEAQQIVDYMRCMYTGKVSYVKAAERRALAIIDKFDRLTGGQVMLSESEPWVQDTVEMVRTLLGRDPGKFGATEREHFTEGVHKLCAYALRSTPCAVVEGEIERLRKIETAARALQFSAYPAHGHGFVITVSGGNINDLEAALAAPPAPAVHDGEGPGQSPLAASLRPSPSASRRSEPSPAEKEGWETISTAPKDGTPILACYWGSPDQEAYPVVSCFWSRISEGWFAEESGHTVKPTHWRPLPAPPAQGDR